MKKKLITLLMVTTLVVSGCGTGSSSKSDATTKTEEAKAPLDLNGTWASEKNDGSWMEADIANGAITINWVSDNGNTKSIYWIGTYDAPKDSNDEYKWTSTRDKEKTKSALLASQDDTKDFSYANKELSYKASALGTTKTMKLKKTK